MCVGRSRNRTKFHYGDRVKVVEGFYSGHKGRVTNFCSESSKYYVEMPTCKNVEHPLAPNLSVWIKESVLQLIED